MPDEKEFLRISLSLSSKELDYLRAAVVDFYHKMRAAAEGDKLVVDFDERLTVARELWKKVEELIND